MSPDPAGRRDSCPPAPAAPAAAPGCPDDLHRWILSTLGLSIPRRALMEGHDAPFDYVCHAFFEDRRPRDVIVWASRGGGKTLLGALATLLDLVFKPGMQVRILGGSLDQSSRMYAHLRGMLEAAPLAALVDGRVSARGVSLVNGSRVEILSQSQRSVRGQRVHKMRCDEVELFDLDVWSAAQLVTRSGICGDGHVPAAIEAISTMHRPYGLMQRLVREAGEAERRVFRWNVIDVLRRCEPERDCATCPILDVCGSRAKAADGFFDIDDAIQQRRRVSDDVWEAEMLCGRPSRRESVYPSFDPSVHVESIEPDPRATWIGGIDFGYNAPTVLLWAQITDDDRLLVHDETVLKRHTTGACIEAASNAKWPRPAWIGADPAGRQTNEQTSTTTIDLWRRAGWPVRDVIISFPAGIGAVQQRLCAGDGTSRLRIHPRCRALIESLTLYRYPPKRPESERPAKDGPDHAADALRYMIINLDRAGLPARWRKY